MPRESRTASGRANPSARAAASVAPERETPGTSAHAWASPSSSPSRGPASSSRRSCGARSASTSATEPATSPAASERGPPRRVSIQRSAANASATAGSSESTATSIRSAISSPPQADQQRDGAARVQRHLDLLAPGAVELRVLPAQQPGQRRDVARRGDREQLGRALEQPERDDLSATHRRPAPRPPRASPRPRRLRTTR